MKLSPIYDEVFSLTKEWIELVGRERVQKHIADVKKANDYNDLECRIANDIVKYGAIYHTKGVNWLCEMLKKYDADDSHLTTLCKKVINQLNLL